MEQEYAADMIVALYTALGDAQAAMEELQAANIPYPDIRLAAHTADDPDRPSFEGTTTPERFWSLSVLLDEQGPEQVAAVEDVLRSHQPFAVGRLPAPQRGRKAADRGAIAWRHYVFETPAATDQVADSAGTTGNTGVISSGVFATGALAEGNPPARGLPEGGKQPSAAAQKPTADDRKQETTSDERSRPQTELK